VQLLTEDLICLTKASMDREIFPHQQEGSFSIFLDGPPLELFLHEGLLILSNSLNIFY